MVLGKTLQSPLDCKEIQPVQPKGDQSWMFIGRTDAEAETPILWPADAKNWLIGKDPDAEKDWGQKEKGYDRGWDGWMVSPTQWTWVWVNSGSWWWTGRPGMLRFTGSQRVGHDWATKWNWDATLFKKKKCVAKSFIRSSKCLRYNRPPGMSFFLLPMRVSNYTNVGLRTLEKRFSASHNSGKCLMSNQRANSTQDKNRWKWVICGSAWLAFWQHRTDFIFISCSLLYNDLEI